MNVWRGGAISRKPRGRALNVDPHIQMLKYPTANEVYHNPLANVRFCKRG